MHKHRCALIAVYIIIAVVAMLHTPVVLYASRNEKSDVIGNMMTWLPLDSYGVIACYNFDAEKNAKLYEIYRSLFEDSRQHDIRWVTPGDACNLFIREATVAMAACRISASIRPETNKEKGDRLKGYRSNEGEMAAEMSFGDEPSVLVAYRPLFVFVYNDANAVLDKLYMQGHIKRENAAINKVKIYIYEDIDRAEKYYLAVAPTGEMLVGKDTSDIESMINAGLGMEMNIFDSEDCLPLLEQYRDLGHYWKYTIGGAWERAVIRRRIEMGGQEGEYRDRLEEIMKGNLYMIETLCLAAEMTQITIWEYGTEERAIIAEKKRKYNTYDAGQQKLRNIPEEIRGDELEIGQWRAEYFSLWEKKRIIARQGCAITEKIEYDEELIRAARIWEAAERSRKKR